MSERRYPVGPDLIGYTKSEQDVILDRLKGFEVIHVARPTGQQAVYELSRKGLVVYRWGEGSDAGVMLVRKPILPPSGPKAVA